MAAWSKALPTAMPKAGAAMCMPTRVMPSFKWEMEKASSISVVLLSSMLKASASAKLKSDQLKSLVSNTDAAAEKSVPEGKCSLRKAPKW